MTIPISTVDAVLDFLLSAITTQINDTSVLVVEGPPGPYQPEDIVSVASDITLDSVPHAFVGSGGAHWIQESYRVSVIVSVHRAGDNMSLVWKRAKALSDAVDTAVRTDPTLGGAVQLSYPSRSIFSSYWADNHAWRFTDITKEITVEAEV